MNSGRADKNPWVKWWWSDWFSDTGVRSVSLAARGLWADMLGIMSRSPRFGYLEKIEEINGELVTKQIDSKTIAKISEESEKTVDELIRELGRHGVYSKTESGIIFCRRMAREHDIAKKREAAGRIGGQSRWQNSSKRIDPSASASASDSLFLSSEEEEKEEKREDPLTDIPKEIIEESTKELQRIFKEGGHSDLLKEKKFLDFMISLCLEYQDRKSVV